MPSAKSGTACSLVPPVAPNTAEEADVADPGTMSEIQATQVATQSGKYGSVPVTPFKPASGQSATSGQSAAGSPSSKDQPKHWIEIQLFDEMDQPVAGEPYEIMLPDQSVASGSTDGQGLARVDGIDAGSCQITFPKRDQEAWSPL